MKLLSHRHSRPSITARRLSGISIIVLLCAAGSQAQDAVDPLISYTLGQSREVPASIEEAIRTGTPGQLAEIERRLLKVLAHPDTTREARDFCCRALARCGTATSVPTLTKLLPDPSLSHMARFALERIPSADADRALRDALKQAGDPQKIGIVNSLGNRKDPAAIPALAKLAAHSDPAIAGAALSALGRIGGSDAARALSSVKVSEVMVPAWADARLQAAVRQGRQGDRDDALKTCRDLMKNQYPVLIRVAALGATVQVDPGQAIKPALDFLKLDQAELNRAAIRFLTDLPGQEATQAFARELPGLTPERQVLLIGALAARGDKASVEPIATLLETEDPQVQLSAINAMKSLGRAGQVPILLRLASAGGDAGKAALQSLGQMSDRGIGEALIKAAKEQEPAIRATAIKALAARNDKGVVGIALEAMRRDDEPVRSAAIGSLADLAGPEEWPTLVEQLVQAKDSSEAKRVTGLLVKVSGRIQDPQVTTPALLAALSKGSPEKNQQVLILLGKVGGEPALMALRTSATAPDPDIRKAAIRAMADWADAKPMEDLIRVAREDTDDTCRILALRGYVRLIGLSNAPAKQQLEAYQAAMDLSKTPQVKRQILSGVGQMKNVAALNFLEPFLEDETLKKEAQAAFNKVGEAAGITAMKNGKVSLQAKNAKIHGKGAVYEKGNDRNCIGNWSDVKTWVSWPVRIPETGTYTVTVSQSMAGQAGSEYDVVIGDGNVSGVVKETGNWAQFEDVTLGDIQVGKPGVYSVEVRPKTKPKSFVMNLRGVRLLKKLQP